MPSIHRLPPHVQNRIAAGEVVERPSAAVKELVENALDAGSRHIAVAIEEGGRRLIRVRDDGCGMDEGDLALSVERHATSKIRDLDDIYRLSTLGFRGEALASIAAVSRLRIVSAVAGSAVGHELVVINGKCEKLSPIAAPAGTTVEVRDLFQATPVRLKFLKSPAAEAAAVAEAVVRLALARPEVAFHLESNGRRVIDLPPQQDLAARIAAIFGREVASLLAPVALDPFPGLRISGFVARPPDSRPHSSHIYLIL
ncbi:MAG: DNA mismatch repair endonuclease MutL, partial [Planctomycetota bacterium]|nr:DNA mismatch repair endonuclease MutL [Planctomycetota bacterium]